MTDQKHAISYKVMAMFFVALLVSLAGMYFGQFIPETYIMPIGIAEMVVFGVVIFARMKKAIGYPLMFMFMFLSGIALYSVLNHYISAHGAGLVFKAFVIAVASFGFTALYAYKKKPNLYFLDAFMLTSLFLILVFCIVGLFVPFGNAVEMIGSGVSVFVFIGFSLYDFSVMARDNYKEEDIPYMVTNIFLNFSLLLNSILDLLDGSSKTKG